MVTPRPSHSKNQIQGRLPQRLLWRSKREKLEATGNHQQEIKGPFCLQYPIANGHMDNSIFAHPTKSCSCPPFVWHCNFVKKNHDFKRTLQIGMIDRNTSSTSKLNYTILILRLVGCPFLLDKLVDGSTSININKWFVPYSLHHFIWYLNILPVRTRIRPSAH